MYFTDQCRSAFTAWVQYVKMLHNHMIYSLSTGPSHIGILNNTLGPSILGPPFNTGPSHVRNFMTGYSNLQCTALGSLK